MTSSKTIHTLATPANMRRAARRPSLRIYAWSPLTGEECSATAGDYFRQPDDEPVLDSEDQPMILVYERTVYVDALTGDVIEELGA